MTVEAAELVGLIKGFLGTADELVVTFKRNGNSVVIYAANGKAIAEADVTNDKALEVARSFVNKWR